MVHRDDASIALCCPPIKRQKTKVSLNPSCIKTTFALLQVCQDQNRRYLSKKA
jgi:hypothetical protein